MYDEWMVNGDKSYYTRVGNFRAPSKTTCLQLSQGMGTRTEGIIHKSFKACGISLKTDGSEDADIHCLKSGFIAEDTVREIVQRTATLETDDSDKDPLADLDDDVDQLETNKVVIDENDD